MAKSLGQIHTVSYELDNLTFPLAAGNKMLIDLPGQLTKSLQHMVRAMSNFKVVGIDMSYGPILNAGSDDLSSASMSGEIKYYAPTQGRIEACKKAYETVRRMMKLSGVTPRHAINYDFRPPFRDPADYENGDRFGNQASIEDNGLATCLANGPGSSNIFGIYNQGIIPRSGLGSVPGFEDGFDIGLRTNADSADWTLNQNAYLQSGEFALANEVPESIPFELSFTAGGLTNVGGTPLTTLAATDDQLSWRPDPALYLSVMTGQLSIEINAQSALNPEGADASDETQLAVSVHVAGWKGFLGSKNGRRR